jgi:starch synthase
MSSDRSLEIAMFSAEAAPYVKVGGLADVVGALPKVLDRLDVKVTVIVPAYKEVAYEKYRIQPEKALSGFRVTVGKSDVAVAVYRARMPETRVDVFFVGDGGYFWRDGIYVDPRTKEPFPDDMQRFIYLMKAGLELLRRRGSAPDVIHCHDSHTALVPALLAPAYRSAYSADGFFRRTGTLLTIHNLAFQGIFPKTALNCAGIGADHFAPGSPFEFWGKVNFMKAGIEIADLVNTVSETYAHEIQTDPDYGCGLEGILSGRGADVSGIVNGIDYEEWNPETDPFIPANYSARNLDGKRRCKAELLKTFGLPPAGECVPLIGIVSRLTDQKGFDLIGEAIRELAGLDLQIVVLGTGQQEYHDLFQQISSAHPGKIAVRFEFNNPLAHQIEAGADMFLMPSKFEPCGLNQLYSLRYGTVPIVRATGGLADTVKNFDLAGDSGTGFSFQEYAWEEMMIAVKRALMVYSDPIAWEELMLRGMAEDWSWEQSARKYVRLYEEIRVRKSR